jgi:septum formation protein
MPDLVLASTSTYRRALLERLGVPFRWRAPLVDESALKASVSDPVGLADKLALAKAESVLAHEADAVVIGCDQVVSFRGRILGKPGTAAGAIAQLALLAGHTHQLITSSAVVRQGEVVRATNVSLLRMRRLSRAAIERYVHADQPFDCAGSYKLESRGIVLFSRIKTEDYTAIIGLPLVSLVTTLREMEFNIP